MAIWANPIAVIIFLPSLEALKVPIFITHINQDPFLPSITRFPTGKEAKEGIMIILIMRLGKHILDTLRREFPLNSIDTPIMLIIESMTPKAFLSNHMVESCHIQIRLPNVYKINIIKRNKFGGTEEKKRRILG